jgi:hypothetical protein
LLFSWHIINGNSLYRNNRKQGLIHYVVTEDAVPPISAPRIAPSVPPAFDPITAPTNAPETLTPKTYSALLDGDVFGL